MTPRESGWRNATSEHQSSPASDNVSSSGWKSAAGPGKIGRAKRSIP